MRRRRITMCERVDICPACGTVTVDVEEGALPTAKGLGQVVVNDIDIVAARGEIATSISI
jgi:hypothetical protein